MLSFYTVGIRLMH